MRRHRALVWARCATLSTTLIALVSLAPTAAVAEQRFDRLFIFGDSFTDVQLAGLWQVYPLPLQQNLGIPQIVEFGVGGARASPYGPAATVPPGWHLQQQVDAYLATGNPIGPRDLVTVNIGGNDGLGILGNAATPANNVAIGYPGVTMTPANASTFANLTADYATSQINRLVNAGGRNFVLGEFSGLSGLPVVPGILAPAADAYGQAYFNGVQTRLAPLALSGVRFFILDLFRLGNAVNADPARFGFVGFNCPGAPPICGGAINSPQQTQFYLGPDGLHLTNGGFALVADYMANIVMAPDTIAVQPDVVQATATAFTGAVLNRLDAMRNQASGVSQYGAGGPMGLGLKDEPAPRPSRFTAYSLGAYAGGQRSDIPGQSGYDYDAQAATIGIDYRVDRSLIVGLAGNYTTSKADLDSGAGINIDAIQIAAYASYSTRHWFGDALLSYGQHELDLARPGVVDWVRSSTDATSFTGAARGGYLFDFGALRAGPIAGLTYARSKVDGYTETGDPLLTFSVAGHTLDALTGSAGIQFRAPFQARGAALSPYLNITVEHEFGDGTRTLTTTLTQAPLLPILTPVSSFEERTYGKVEGGVAFQVGPNVSATVSAASTFARDSNDFLISGGLNYRF